MLEFRDKITEIVPHFLKFSLEILQVGRAFKINFIKKK